MFDFIKELVIKLIPTNWYETYKTCQMVDKICDTLIELKWFVFPTLIVVVVGIVICFVYICQYALPTLLAYFKKEKESKNGTEKV
ncbi:MAG: hypothetical protein LBC06_01140 [Rickettsiales bacterium]|jgi:hypothetical protein|nr:hypothetical protein [Rickettsiales bacterium]